MAKRTPVAQSRMTRTKVRTRPRVLARGAAFDFLGFFQFVDPARGKLLSLAREILGLPDGPQLQNLPNPFNSETISRLQLRPGPSGRAR